MMQNNAIACEANLIEELCNRWVFKLSGDSQVPGCLPLRLRTCQTGEAFCMNHLSLHSGFKGGGISVCWLNEKRLPKS